MEISGTAFLFGSRTGPEELRLERSLLNLPLYWNWKLPRLLRGAVSKSLTTPCLYLFLCSPNSAGLLWTYVTSCQTRNIKMIKVGEMAPLGQCWQDGGQWPLKREGNLWAMFRRTWDDRYLTVHQTLPSEIRLGSMECFTGWTGEAVIWEENRVGSAILCHLWGWRDLGLSTTRKPKKDAQTHRSEGELWGYSKTEVPNWLHITANFSEEK